MGSVPSFCSDEECIFILHSVQLCNYALAVSSCFGWEVFVQLTNPQACLIVPLDHRRQRQWSWSATTMISNPGVKMPVRCTAKAFRGIIPHSEMLFFEQDVVEC